MKKILCIALVAVIAVGAFALGRVTAPAVDSKTFYAVIEQTDGEHFVVSGLEVNDINHRWQFQFSLEDAPILWRGTELTAAELDVGDTIAITYTGSVLEVSPAIIQTVLKVELLDDER